VQLVSYDRWHAIDFILLIAPVEISLGNGNLTLVREKVSNVPRVITLEDRTAVAAKCLTLATCCLCSPWETACPIYEQLELFIVALSARSK
jgi:hypothetical protein